MQLKSRYKQQSFLSIVAQSLVLGLNGSYVTLKIRVVEWPRAALHSLALELILLSAITYYSSCSCMQESLIRNYLCIQSCISA